jgi:hypothetical protein
VFIPLLATLGVGVLFYVLGRRTREQTDAGPVEAAVPA